MFYIGFASGMVLMLVLVSIVIIIAKRQPMSQPDWNREFVQQNKFYMDQMVSTWQKVSAALDIVIERHINQQPKLNILDSGSEKL